MVYKMKALCDMTADCTAPVTHIGEKGYIYCTGHAPERKGIERVRKMVPWERKRIERGQPLPSYKRGKKPTQEVR